MTDFLTTTQDRKIAFEKQTGTGPGVVFLGGFRSDMTGTKAQALADWAQASGRSFVRFDYSGHGQSSGRFEQGAIGDWAQDAAEVLAKLCDGPQILVGSSMGGWISLLLARTQPDQVAGLIGIAAAPDFTTTIWQDLGPEGQAEMQENGRILQPSDYSDAPYVITQRLIEDGAHQCVLTQPLPLACPVRLLQGTHDTDVPPAVALSLLDHATGPDIRLTLVKGADHRFSTPECLALVTTTLDEMIKGMG